MKSKAVIANMMRTTGIVLWFTTGTDEEESRIAMEINAIGSMRLDDLGLDDAPDGISIWEGDYVWQSGPYEAPNDGQSMPEGIFRAPTDEEWLAIRQNRSPWGTP